MQEQSGSEISVIWHHCGQEYHKIQEESWTWDECASVSVWTHTHTHISRDILSHSKVFAHNSKPSATLFVPQRYLTLTCTKDLSSCWSLGAQTGWRTLLLSCYGVWVIPDQLLWLQCCSSDQGSSEPVLMLLEMKMCKQKASAPTEAHFWVVEGQAAYTGIMSIRQQVPVELGYLGPAKDCRSMSDLQVS